MATGSPARSGKTKTKAKAKAHTKARAKVRTKAIPRNDRAKTNAGTKPSVRAKASAKTAAKSPAVTIAAIALSRDGAWWNITLSTKRRVRVAAGAALAVRARIGARWTKALETRIARLEDEQKAYTLALELLAKDPRLTKAQLTAHLGGDDAAREAVRGLVSNGWL